VNIMPKMVYDCLDEDPLVLVSWCLQLADSTRVQPYGLSKDVLIGVRGSSTLVDFLVMDMDPRQQISIIVGAPFLRSVKDDINERKRSINMRVKGKHEKFTFHPKNLTYLYQVQVYHQRGSNKVEYVEVLPYELEHLKRNDNSQNKGPRSAKTPGKNSLTHTSIQSQNLCDASGIPCRLCHRLQSHRRNNLQGMEIVLPTNFKHEALVGRIAR
jgi:hypothetical protein